MMFIFFINYLKDYRDENPLCFIAFSCTKFHLSVYYE